MPNDERTNCEGHQRVSGGASIVSLDPRYGSGETRIMRAKELALDVIKHLPDDASMHDVTEELYAAAVREGLEELDRGEGIDHEDVKRQFGSWFTE